MSNNWMYYEILNKGENKMSSENDLGYIVIGVENNRIIPVFSTSDSDEHVMGSFKQAYELRNELQDLYPEIEYHVLAIKNKKYEVDDGVVTYGEKLYWKSAYGIEVIEGDDWKVHLENIETRPKYYSIKRPVIASVSYYDNDGNII